MATYTITGQLRALFVKVLIEDLQDLAVLAEKLGARYELYDSHLHVLCGDEIFTFPLSNESYSAAQSSCMEIPIPNHPISIIAMYLIKVHLGDAISVKCSVNDLIHTWEQILEYWVPYEFEHVGYEGRICIAHDQVLIVS